eukprot:g2925.t1
MGLLQMLLDAWLGTTGLAFLRRAGVFAAPRLEHIRHPTVRRVFGQFLQLGESSADHIEAAAKAAQAASIAGRITQALLSNDERAEEWDGNDDEVDKRTSAEKPDEETGEKTPNRRRFKSVAPPPRAVLGGRFGWEKGYADWEKAEKADGEGAEGE